MAAYDFEDLQGLLGDDRQLRGQRQLYQLRGQRQLVDTLANLTPAQLEEHILDVLECLNHNQGSVRTAALLALSRLEITALQRLAGVIEGPISWCLRDASCDVRNAAFHVFKKLQENFRHAAKRQIQSMTNKIAANWNSINGTAHGLCGLLQEVGRDCSISKRRFVEITIANRLFERYNDMKQWSHGHAAWPVAHVAKLVFTASSVVRAFVRSCVYKNCPFLVPARNAFPHGQRSEETRKEFTDRIRGVARLWFAIAVLEENVALLWLWLRKLVSLPPTHVSALLLLTFLEMAGEATQRRYQRRFHTVLRRATAAYLAAPDVVGSDDATMYLLRRRLESARFFSPVGRNVEIAEESVLEECHAFEATE